MITVKQVSVQAFLEGKKLAEKLSRRFRGLRGSRVRSFKKEMGLLYTDGSIKRGGGRKNDNESSENSGLFAKSQSS